MGCFLFLNYHFQMGVTVMGFAEDFGQYYAGCWHFELLDFPLKSETISSIQQSLLVKSRLQHFCYSRVVVSTTWISIAYTI